MKYLSNLFIISAASGSGKTSLVKSLIKKTPDLVSSTSFTTRVKRPKEENGIDYFFVTKNTFETMTNNNEFLETSIIFDNYYGTNKVFVEQLLSEGKDIILEIDWQGAKKIKAYLNQISNTGNQQIIEYTSIFILPPSIEALSKRLTNRGQDNLEIIEKRLNAAKQEIKHYIDYDYILINDDFNQAIYDLSVIINAQKLKKSRQEILNSNLIKNLLL